MRTPHRNGSRPPKRRRANDRRGAAGMKHGTDRRRRVRKRLMIRTSHIVLLSCLLASAALAAPERQENALAASAPAQTSLIPAKLKAMPTARLLKLGQAALTADAETPAFTTGLDALKVASSRGDRVATRMLGKVMARRDFP